MKTELEKIMNGLVKDTMAKETEVGFDEVEINGIIYYVKRESNES